MHVLLIGAGRYGNNLIGRKYASGELGVKLAGIVDPRIDEIKRSATYCMNGIPAYHSIEEVPKKLMRNSIIDIALIPQIILENFGKLIDKGAKKFILPKPVTTNFQDYKTIQSLTKCSNAQSYIASNWHYSDITKRLRTLIQKVSESLYEKNIDKKHYDNLNKVIPEIKNVELNYSKKDEVLTIDPPLQELPHALQILYSTGLLKNFEEIKTILLKELQSKSRVNLSIKNIKGIKEGISVDSDLKMGGKIKKNRVREIKIFLENKGTKTVITADYDARFDEKGFCEKLPRIDIEETTLANEPKHIFFEINEDNINVMYNSILDAFKGSETQALTLEEYSPIAKYLSEIEGKWQESLTIK